MPPLDHLHPAVVHFPIALWLTAPLLGLLALAWPPQRKGLMAAALVLLVIGLGAALVALATGEAAEPFTRRTPELRAAFAVHEARARMATTLFAALTFALALLAALPRLLRRTLSEGLLRALLGLWLLASAGGALVLLRAGHEGGRMVHELHTHGD